jgi:hypothetical protein
MALKIEKDIANSNYNEFYRPYKQHRMLWFKDANRFENFRYNQHFSDNEIQELLKFRQAPLPLGITAAICEMAESLLTASDPIPRVIPVPYSEENPKHEIAKSVAYRYNAALKSTWRESMGSLQFDKVIRDFDNVGLGYNYVLPRSEFGQFFVDYKHIPWYNVYMDYTSRDVLFRDAEAQVISFVLSLKQAYKLAKQVQPNLKWDEFKKDWWSRDFVDTSTDEYRTKYSSQIYNPQEVIRLTVRYMLEEETVHQVIVKDKDIQVPYKILREVTDEHKKLEAEGKIALVEKKKEYLTEYTSLGSYGWKKVIPISNFVLVPTIYDHRENPYPHGRVWYIYPLQRAFNKFISLSILNASLSNSLKYFAEANTIVDYEKVKDFASVPGVFIQWRRSTPDAKPPIPVQPIPLSDAFLQFPKFIIYLMEYVSGIWGVMQGDASEAPNVFSTVASLQSAGGLKIKRRLRNIEASLSQTGRVVAELYREYAPPDGQIVDVQKEKINTIDYNTVQLGKNNEVTIKPETDLSVGFKDVEFSVESSKGFQAATESAMLTTMATQLKIPELVPLILDRMGIQDVDKVVKQITQRVEMAQRMQGMEQQLQELVKQNKELQNQVVGKTIEVIRAETKGKAGRLVERFRQQLEKAGVNIDEFSNAVNSEFGGNGQQQQQPSFEQGVQ